MAGLRDRIAGAVEAAEDKATSVRRRKFRDSRAEAVADRARKEEERRARKEAEKAFRQKLRQELKSDGVDELEDALEKRSKASGRSITGILKDAIGGIDMAVGSVEGGRDREAESTAARAERSAQVAAPIDATLLPAGDMGDKQNLATAGRVDGSEEPDFDDDPMKFDDSLGLTGGGGDSSRSRKSKKKSDSDDGDPLDFDDPYGLGGGL